MNHGALSTAAANATAPPPKPIRFVTNHDGPYAKRRRINSACLTCRRKKTRCSGERPVCGTCAQNKHECAGYGDDTAAEPGRDSKKTARRESVVSTASATARKSEAPVDPAESSRPRLPHLASSNVSQLSDSSVNLGALKQEDQDEDGLLSLNTRNRMPYFRYFGPTAIMPGFRQMVVKVRGQRHGSNQTTSDQHGVDSSPAEPHGSPTGAEARTPLEIPVYDNSDMSPSPLITHLCKVFFVNLGCCFPFLQHERFMRDLEEKQVDAILVDAVCALAARFSTHPMLARGGTQQKEGSEKKTKTYHPEAGQAFAQRAKSNIPDAFPCPNVAVVQAALLLAYDEFGGGRDSGLWMYLGIAIRMAQDLGMQTLEGLKYEGRNGITPKLVKTDTNTVSAPALHHSTSQQSREMTSDEQERRAVERERLDTFWSIFFLDRVISSGTGRPVTIRDRDIEISFPSLDEVDTGSGWPLPFPALIRIIHLYGRVTDLLNRVRDVSDITRDLQKQLDALENRLTEIYQNLSPKLHFNAVNFQQYVKFNQGTNFLLLHCWFHTLIVLLHQPTLLKPFEGSPQSLSANSRELSMSSAKTIADILSFTELIDTKTGVCNPFTSQPIYIAACAFLQESAMHSASSQPQSRPQSRPASPGPRSEQRAPLTQLNLDKSMSNGDRSNHLQDREQKQAAKHTLLASAANQNYQRCHRALKSIETYWEGVKYIITVLDQKAKGIDNPLLYTREEMESALEVPRPEPSFSSPGWRRKLSWGTYLTAQTPDGDMANMPAAIRQGARTPTIPGSPMGHSSQAIGWSLTGTMNSPSTNVAVMYPSETGTGRDAKSGPPKRVPTSTQPSIASLISNTPIKFEAPQPPMPSPSLYPPFDPASMPPPPANNSYGIIPAPDPALVSDADLLLNLHSPFNNASPGQGPLQNTTSYVRSASMQNNQGRQVPSEFSPTFGLYPTPSDNVFGDMVIDTQDVDMSVLGADMMPWDLEYLPHDMLYFGDGTFGTNDMGGAQ
ncbi:fungal-specific transcription factor domain-containing protein [Boeremia exigua]|uniref:fungal-specific transcription factor domain-containing protein n=1 Tax=Boeremia exigua TaxID=749465 RepID=UPI001E8DC631|nr:fungal-specific transcription factor domain-containing protein [Boeremia exigua]KAH6644716.1 fungal-specific transcription factor domain-containing protein [Boeremia exigua]